MVHPWSDRHDPKPNTHKGKGAGRHPEPVLEHGIVGDGHGAHVFKRSDRLRPGHEDAKDGNTPRKGRKPQRKAKQPEAHHKRYAPTDRKTKCGGHIGRRTLETPVHPGARPALGTT
jgi:hypothetical protein